MLQNWDEKQHTENVPVYYLFANRDAGDIFKPFLGFRAVFIMARDSKRATEVSEARRTSK